MYNQNYIYSRAIFRSLAHLELKTSLKACQTSTLISLFKHFQGHLGIFGDTDTFSATLTGAQLGGGGRPPPPFFESRKKCPDFGKKRPDCVHPWVTFSIQNIVLVASRRKNSKIFPCESFFLVFLTKCLLKCHSSTKPPSALKIFWLRACAQALFFFCKRSILNGWQCFE